MQVLVDARTALLTLTERVYLAGQDLPDDDGPIIRLDAVNTVDRVRYGGASTLTRIQVVVWAADLDTALPLSEQARELLLAARFVPDGGGALTDPETTQIGWRADYRRQ